ncbi:Zinc finger protein 362 [Araneus ventricosus]|uniref:Zinc finger protein 362 n=1 Tax=Araneus ventricosus TaxID=182803 RepID=A0A4Y2A2U1_ARAVE|nr:Zinc finger protein 362 [Araneus ventricosus]
MTPRYRKSLSLKEKMCILKKVVENQHLKRVDLAKELGLPDSTLKTLIYKRNDKKNCFALGGFLTPVNVNPIEKSECDHFVPPENWSNLSDVTAFEEFVQCNSELATCSLLTIDEMITNEETSSEEDNCTEKPLPSFQQALAGFNTMQKYLISSDLNDKDKWGSGLGEVKEEELIRVKIFLHKSAMQHHAREIHRGEVKPHQCQQCLKSFSSNHQLTQHIRIHTGEKPYKCSYCDRRFKQLSHVQQHTRLHTGAGGIFLDGPRNFQSLIGRTSSVVMRATPEPSLPSPNYHTTLKECLLNHKDLTFTWPVYTAVFGGIGSRAYDPTAKTLCHRYEISMALILCFISQNAWLTE